ncbi:hypothetical protein F5883DRAFT_404722 [Diaporthe sp. PMI_573]|nr:hypothetical protein F5883DRAFT_404722 [Diaporthaceae sp. PMI_573]
MGEGPVVAIIRGLKVRIRVLDRFLYSNGCHDTEGIPPFYEENPDEFSTLLRSKLSRNNTSTRLFVPTRMSHNRSNFGYIAWAYEMVYAQREVLLEESLPLQPPEGWESLKNETISFSASEDEIWEASGHGKTGVFVVVCDDKGYIPPSIDQRPSHCEQCEAMFDSYIDRQSHRRTEHASEEGLNPVPDDE